jgi:uncharacterized protein DUF5947
MAAPTGLASPRLARLARQGAAPPAAPAPAPERCDLCGQPVPAEHRHLVDIESRELKCTCQACRILFDRREAGGGHFRLVPDRRRRLDDFVMDDVVWASLAIPVDMAFFFHATPAGRVVAFYPGPMGATESQLELDAWATLVAANPVLEDMEDDVEALLVHRARGAREHWLVGLDDCYELVGLIRSRWRGLTGGAEVWDEIARFFDTLNRRATPARGRGREQP